MLRHGLQRASKVITKVLEQMQTYVETMTPNSRTNTIELNLKSFIKALEKCFPSQQWRYRKKILKISNKEIKTIFSKITYARITLPNSAISSNTSSSKTNLL